jgi:hypothetical protein
MKQTLLFALILGAAAAVSAQVQLPEHRFASGNWSIAEGRVYQNDMAARLAKVNLRIPQNGPMIYEFNARYEAGLQGGRGGFGIHIFADTIYNGASWGCGRSYLLWLNYDEKPLDPAIPSGLSAQVYRSSSHSRMDLVQSIDLNQYADLLTPENLSYPVPFRIWADGGTGEVRVYDPTDPDLEEYFFFTVEIKDLPLQGNWIALRTNGMRLSFTN